MPNRVLQSSSLTSESLSHLSAESERLFHRLVLVADDWGRFEARNSVIRSGCFPVHDIGISLGEIDDWLAGLLDQNIIYTYSSNGRVYGHFVNWWKYQRWRNNKSKHPEPQNGDLRELPHVAASRGETEELAVVSQNFAANNKEPAAETAFSPLAHGRGARAATGVVDEDEDEDVVGVVDVVEDVVEDEDDARAPSASSSSFSWLDTLSQIQSPTPAESTQLKDWAEGHADQVLVETAHDLVNKWSSDKARASPFAVFRQWVRQAESIATNGSQGIDARASPLTEMEKVLAEKSRVEVERERASQD